MFNHFPSFHSSQINNSNAEPSSSFSRSSDTPAVFCSNLHPLINPQDLKKNGFLLTDDEKEKMLFYMKDHESENEVIPGNAAMNHEHHGALLINRKTEKIYKIYNPETDAEKEFRKAILKDLNIFSEQKGILGQGGFGKICICQDLTTGDWYAVKKIKKSMFGKVCYLSGLGTYNQPNEITFLKQQNLFIDCIETTNKYYIIEKLISGCNLNQYAASNFNSLHSHDGYRGAIEKLFNTLNKMVESLANFHSHHSIHCDVSLDNFIYDKNTDEMYLIDFGLSMRLPNNINGIFCLVAAGKDDYIAPEIIGTFLSYPYYSYSSDVYALGICFEKMLSKAKFLDFYFYYSKQLTELVNEMTNPDSNLRANDLSYVSRKLIALRQQLLNELDADKAKKDINSKPRIKPQPTLRDLLFFNKPVPSVKDAKAASKEKIVGLHYQLRNS